MTPDSIFTLMMRGDRPARFVWSDDDVVALLSETPLTPGHTLVVPRRVVDNWIDLDPALLEHLMGTAQRVARAIQAVFEPVRVGVLIAGVEVRHVHVHLAPISSARDFDFGRQDPTPDPARLDEAADAIRSALADLGHAAVVPDLGRTGPGETRTGAS